MFLITTPELDASDEGTTHDRRSMAAQVDRGVAKVAAPKGRRVTPRRTQGRPKKDKKKRKTKTHELDESGEGTTHDHRSTATFESRRKSRAKVWSFIAFCVTSPELAESGEGDTHDHRSMATKVDRARVT